MTNQADGYLTINILQFTTEDLLKSRFSLDGQLEFCCRTCKAVTKHRHVSAKNKRLHSWIDCLTCDMGNTTSLNDEVALIFLHIPDNMNKLTIGHTSDITMMVLYDEKGNHRKVKIEPEHINEYILNLITVF